MAQRRRMVRATKKPRAKVPVIPPRIFAQASPRSVAGSRCSRRRSRSTRTRSRTSSRSRTDHGAVNRLQEAGFEVLQITEMTINIAGPRRDVRAGVQDAARTPRSGRSSRSGAWKTTATFLDSPDDRAARPDRAPRHAVRGRARGRGDRGAALLHGALDVPADQGVLASARCRRRLARLQRRPGAPRRHHRPGRQGGDGRQRLVPHPFFAARGYRVAPVDARARRRPTRWPTRAATAPASRPTSSRSRPTSSCCR